MFSSGVKIGNALRPPATGSSSARLSTDVSPMGDGGGTGVRTLLAALLYLVASPLKGSMRAGLPALLVARREHANGDGVGTLGGWEAFYARHHTTKQER